MITLYSTHCPRCVVLEAKLKQQGIDFVLNEDEEEMRQKGFLSAPILEVDERGMDFGEAIKWLGEHKSGTDLGVVGANECASCRVG